MYEVCAFYKFKTSSADEVLDLKQDLQRLCKEHAIRGLILLATEGINATVAGTSTAINALVSLIIARFGVVDFKESKCDFQPFRRMAIQMREELITCGDPSIRPDKEEAPRLSPAEWDSALQGEDVVVIDTRNLYESKIGHFKNAIVPKIDVFSEYADWVQQSGIGKDKTVLMYCTGGIRCEKAALIMQRQGYKHVYQLDGGILNYLSEFPDGKFEGECFVFDHRVALKGDLTPSEIYKLCPHCGNAGYVHIDCRRCGKAAVVCPECAAQTERMTCSKNCAHILVRDAGKPVSGKST